MNGSSAPDTGTTRTFLGHPPGLFLLFLVEMWERFSYSGTRAILVLYLTSPTTGMRVLPPGAPEGFNPGRGWADEAGYTALGWYTGLCYLTPILGGMIADTLIGTHRSMVVGGLLIALGHVMLGVSGVGAFETSALGMSVFVFGLVLVILGTGHFKPCVSVMVGQLYKPDDPRRESAFGIFYMGINLGSALQVYIVGTLGELVGWHWGFGAAAAGMLLGLAVYTLARPLLLHGVGLPPGQRGGAAAFFVPLAILVAGGAAYSFHQGWLSQIERLIINPWVWVPLVACFVGWALAYIFRQAREDRGPVASIFIFMVFNIVFWLSFEQAGSSINIFTDRHTDRTIELASPIRQFAADANYPFHWGGLIALGAAIAGGAFCLMLRGIRVQRSAPQLTGLLGTLAGLIILALGICKPFGALNWIADFRQVPTTWFQSINPWLIIIFAPITGALWTALARRKADPSQPIKIGMGLLGVGLGYLFLVAGAMTVKDGKQAAMFYIFATYFVHTMGEIILSPTGLSYVSKAAPRHSVSLLMGIWFISSFVANLGAGKVAAAAAGIRASVPWKFGGEADFFFLFVVTSCFAGALVLGLTPVLRKLMRPGT